MGVDRTVTVRLRAVNDAYRRAMAEAAASTTALGVAGTKAFKDLGTSAYDLGSSLERRLTLPLLALGTAAVKMGNDFEMSFAHMVGLADVPKSEIEGLKQSVLDLSKDTAQAPTELANALYYVRSAGIGAAEGNDILKFAAEGATAGMGSAADVAKFLTFSMNAYGKTGLTAGHAMDVLSAAVRAGTLEASDLVPVMGQVIPLASAMGVSIESVMSTIATMSRNGATGAQAVTGITAALSGLLHESKAGQAALAEHGLSLESLRNIAAGPEGLVGVFRTLDETFQHNDETLAAVVPNIRALRTYMNVLSQDGAKVDEVIGQVTNSTGSFDTALKAVTETKAFRIKQDVNEAKIALVNLGGALAPIVANLADVAGAGFDAFSGMSGGAKEAVASFGLLLLVLGPVSKFAGMLVTNWKLVDSTITKLSTGIQGLTTYFTMAGDAEIGAGAAAKLFAADATAAAAAAARVVLPIIAISYAVTTLIGKWQDHQREARENQAAINDMISTLSQAATVAEGAGKIIGAALNPAAGSGENSDLIANLREVGISVDDVTKAALAGGDAVQQLHLRLAGLSADDLLKFQNMKFTDDSDAGKELDKLIGRFRAAQAAMEQWRIAQVRSGSVHIFTPGSLADIGAAEAALKGLPPVIEDVGTAADDAAARVKAMLATFQDMVGQIFGAGAQQRDFADAVDAVGKSTESASGSTRNLVQEERDAVKSAEAVANAKRDQAKAEQELVDARKGPTERELIDAAINSQEATLGVRDAQHSLTQAQKALTEERKKGKNADMVGATLSLQHAQLNLRKAQLQAKDAQKDQNDVMNEGAETSKRVTDAVLAVEDANIRVRDALWAEEAQQTKTTETAGKAVDKQKELAGQIDTVIGKGQSWIEQLIKLGAPGSEVIAAIQNQATEIDKLIGKYGDANGLLHKQLELLLNIAIAQGLNATTNPETGWVYYELPGVPAASKPVGRANGGPLDRGTSYQINEQGTPELLTMGSTSAGHMTPLRSLISGASGGSSTMSAPVSIALDRREMVRFLITASHDDGGWAMKITPR